MTLEPWTRLLVLTVVVECAIAVLLAGRGSREWTLACCVLANLATHPPATLLLGWYGFPVVPVEAAVMAVEAPAYRYAAGLPWRRALLVSAVANGVTWALGSVL